MDVSDEETSSPQNIHQKIDDSFHLCPFFLRKQFGKSGGEYRMGTTSIAAESFPYLPHARNTEPACPPHGRSGSDWIGARHGARVAKNEPAHSFNKPTHCSSQHHGDATDRSQHLRFPLPKNYKDLLKIVAYNIQKVKARRGRGVCLRLGFGNWPQTAFGEAPVCAHGFRREIQFPPM